MRVKDYLGVKCPRCGGHLDMLVEPDKVTMGDDRTRSAMSRTPAVYVTWKTSVISHDCDNPNGNGHSYVEYE